MSGRRILLIQGHPDASTLHLRHALADASAQDVRAAGHAARLIDVARPGFAFKAEGSTPFGHKALA